MNLKNVLRLISVDVKSGRLIRAGIFRRYKERRIYQYLLYGGACIIGLLVGLAVGNLYSRLPVSEEKTLLHQTAQQLFTSLPTIVLLYSLVFTMMGQIQRSGIKVSIQPPYWLPITWGEHTLAASFAHIIGLPLASIVLLSTAVFSLSIFLAELPLATITILALLASAFLASTTTEIFRVLQVRITGSVYKSSGKVAIWVRFLGSLLFLVVFYIVWFSISSGSGLITIIETVTGVQGAVWFFPYVWLGMTLSSFINGLTVQTIIFSLASIAFILLLFYLAVKFNTRFGLYEPPAITVSKGVYVPKTSLLGKFGFSSLEAAVIRKDFKAFTRRRELMYTFIMPIIIIIAPLMQYLGMLGASVPSEASLFLVAWILLAPGPLMAMMVGIMIIGEEGSSVWLFYSSPITTRSLVKCKYAFMCILSFAVMLICGAIGILVTRPSLQLAFTLLIESTFLIFALGAVSLRAGIKGADFVETPRPRMVRPLTSVINTLMCMLLAVVTVSPLIPYAMSLISLPFTIPLPEIDVYVAISISAVIAFVITFVFYRMAFKNAAEFLTKAEV
ncbi:MAG: hypothetical protein OEY22_08630 [Candidatus Bathyarchaeota archaeon]|nr:hypothetical protein [Candidatus Bathyarchaeota archaeon]